MGSKELEFKQSHIWLPMMTPSTLERVDLIIPRHVSAADFDYILSQIQSFREGLTGEPDSDEPPIPSCGRCGTQMQIVRPGKHQCPKCD